MSPRKKEKDFGANPPSLSILANRDFQRSLPSKAGYHFPFSLPRSIIRSRKEVGNGNLEYMKKEKDHLFLLNLDQANQESDQNPPDQAQPDSATPEEPPRGPALELVDKAPHAIWDFFRAMLILLSIVVAAGFALIVLPQPTVDKMTQDLRSRRGEAHQEKIAFLYLGDKTENNSFHIRGIVRNIANENLQNLDAAVRVYSHDGTIIETTMVRMNKEMIGPDDTAEFDLVYPNYQSQFKSYSVEFKFRDGEVAPYKDMRASRTSP
jgi:hypothetical protein